MRYLPHTDEDIAAMLAAVGVDGLDDLFSSIPEDCRRQGGLDLPEPLTEWELNDAMKDMAACQNMECRIFIGAGSYRHFTPAAVSHLSGRGEFLTAYTPYQPEVSQGTLQAIYEYQTLVSRLLGLDVANASMYDGATALVEALLMAIRIKRRNKVAVSSNIHPAWRQVIETYFKPAGFEILDLPWSADGRSDPAALGAAGDLAAVAVQSPNFFGCVEDLADLADAAHQRDALFITAFTEPLAYGLFKNPGSLGADIACGEGQSFGVPQSFGGPGLGMFATRMPYVRNIPGRLVGQTTDLDGRRGFVLTLSTREQHIRREKAVSNICTNNSHCALIAAMYMASLGADGMKNLAALNRDKAEYLKNRFLTAGLEIPFASTTFNEFVVKFPDGFELKHSRLRKKGIVAGLPLAGLFPELKGCHLFCVTEVFSKQDLDELVEEVLS